MIGLKRFIRPEFVCSVVLHAGLLVGLLVGASGVSPVPPEVMTVEIVPASEAPQAAAPQSEASANDSENIEGTPLESKTTGSELSSNSAKGSATAAPPRPKVTARPSLQQEQAPAKAQRSASAADAQPQTAPPPQPETQPQASEPLLAPPAPPGEFQPHPREAADQPNAGEMFAMPLALPGGKLGGGFDAPASNPAMLPHDDIAAFRTRLSSCSHLPPNFGGDDSVAIVVRVSFKRDGTLASPPQLLHSSLSPDAAPLLQSAVTALEKCQPFTELPADKYRKWKTLDLVVTPLALSGGG
jgi:hypothetical protein